MTDEIQEYIVSLDSALAKLPDSPGTYYRIIPIQYASSYEVGSIVLEKAYTSTDKINSYNEFIPAVRLTIFGKTGKNIDRFSSAVRESETLFPRNSRFLVKSRRTSPTGQIFIELEQIKP